MAPDVFSALANPVRRRLLDALLDGPRAAGDLAGRFDLSRPAVSEHLQVLRQVGLVREEPRGRQRYYHLDPRPLAEVGRWLHPFENYWRGRLDALGALLDAEADDVPRPADSPDPDGSR
ncbi:metalloregulator ArsR/SmtB family transcription factor [Kitasatospora cinereorecta]|uniref:ArsR/SmtB family transcription factor n=1 Tax=Kitasatospora cinereorecta TaxID=285560 RepID=A0ABW0VJQ2_9ACTN